MLYAKQIINQAKTQSNPLLTKLQISALIQLFQQNENNILYTLLQNALQKYEQSNKLPIKRIDQFCSNKIKEMAKDELKLFWAHPIDQFQYKFLIELNNDWRQMSLTNLRIYGSLLTLLRHPNYYLRMYNTQITSYLIPFCLKLLLDNLQPQIDYLAAGKESSWLRLFTTLVCLCWQIIKQIAKFRKMDYFEPKRSRSSRFILQASEEEYSFSSPNQQKSAKTSHQQFQILYVARERFCDFVNELGQYRYSEIREDILSHCEQNTKKQKLYESYMSDETILKIINLRIDKMIKNKRIKKNWSQEDVQILLWVISKYADKKKLQDIQKDLDSQDWQAIASLIPGVTAESCMFKWLSLKKVNLATNNWSQEESNLLAKLVNQKSYQGKTKDTKDWKMISQRLYFLNSRQDKIFRNAKQCREHWNCYLNPNLKKGPWKPEQDIQLLKCIKQNKGSKKWSEIVKYFDGRTENALKNRYTLIIDKQKKHNKHKSELQIIQQYLVKCYVDQFTTQIKQFSSSSQDIQESVNSFEQALNQQNNSIDDKFFTPQKEEPDANKRMVVSPSTPITPVKIQKFGEFLSFMSAKRIDLHSIQFGTLNNGVFEKAEAEDKTSMDSSSYGGKLHLKKYNSSVF